MNKTGKLVRTIQERIIIIKIFIKSVTSQKNSTNIKLKFLIDMCFQPHQQTRMFRKFTKCHCHVKTNINKGNSNML